MWAYFKDLLDTDSLSPHGICLLWRPELIWTHVVSDFMIGASYFSIPVFLGWLVWKRPDISFGWVVWCFAVFILACGATHFFSIWTLWFPDYGAEALIKAVTAGASIATAVALWPLLPKALAWPSPKQLAFANSELMALVAERDARWRPCGTNPLSARAPRRCSARRRRWKRSASSPAAWRMTSTIC